MSVFGGAPTHLIRIPNCHENDDNAWRTADESGVELSPNEDASGALGKATKIGSGHSSAFGYAEGEG